MLRQLCAVWAASALVAAAAAAADAGFQTELFNGRDLDGWQVTGCQAADEPQARSEGHIGFLGLGARVELRNMRIQDFAASTAKK